MPRTYSEHVTTGTNTDASTGRQGRTRLRLNSERAGPIGTSHVTFPQCRNKPSASPLRFRPFLLYLRRRSSYSYYIRIDSCATGSFFILKFRSMPYKYILFILTIVQRSAEPFHLLFCSLLCLKILTTIFSSKILYIKPHLSLKRIEQFLPSLRLRSS